jgi:hypothetical protein
MIRVLAIVQGLVFVCLLLYLPAVQPAEQWMQRLRDEVRLHQIAWGPQHTQRTLEQALQRSAGLRQAAPSLQPPSETPSSPAGPMDAAIAAQMSAAVARLSDSSYLRAMEMLMTVAMFRLSALLSVLPWVAGPALTLPIDGVIRRKIKSREFLQHRPEAFAAGLAGMLLALGMSAIAFIAPLTVHPLFLFSVPLALALCLRLAIANYHARA